MIQDGIWLSASETVMAPSSRINFRSKELIDFLTNIESDIEISDGKVNVGNFSANIDEAGLRDL